VTQKTDRDVRLNSSLNAQRGEAQSAERSSLAEDFQRLAEHPEKKTQPAWRLVDLTYMQAPEDACLDVQ
jgi:hypothetical protein